MSRSDLVFFTLGQTQSESGLFFIRLRFLCHWPVLRNLPAVWRDPRVRVPESTEYSSLRLSFLLSVVQSVLAATASKKQQLRQYWFRDFNRTTDDFRTLQFLIKTNKNQISPDLLLSILFWGKDNSRNLISVKVQENGYQIICTWVIFYCLFEYLIILFWPLNRIIMKW